MSKEGDGTTPVRIESAIVGILDKEAVQRIRQRQALAGGVFEDITGAMVAQERRKLIRQLVLKTLLPLGRPYSGRHSRGMLRATGRNLRGILVDFSGAGAPRA